MLAWQKTQVKVEFVFFQLGYKCCLCHTENAKYAKLNDLQNVYNPKKHATCTSHVTLFNEVVRWMKNNNAGTKSTMQ